MLQNSVRLATEQRKHFGIELQMTVCWANYNILGCDQDRGTRCCVENLTAQIA